MTTRYQQLRQCIARFAASADEQHAYLERILGPEYGNDELAEEFNDIYIAAGEMRLWGEITETEIRAAKPLEALLDEWRGKTNADFWRREALWSDPRWEQLRDCARSVLSKFPDEERPSDWMNDRG